MVILFRVGKMIQERGHAMKRYAVICPALLCCVVLCGCAPGKLVEAITGRLEPQDGDTYAVTPAPHASRVYMDEMEGVLSGFDGSHLTVLAGEEEYEFDVSGASIECAGGLLYGDEISVIYEGRLNGMHTENVRALKVTDSLHKKDSLKEHKLSGQITALTPWSVTVRTGSGQTVQCTAAGEPMYFSSGVILGNPVTVHLKGEIPENQGTAVIPLLNVLSISDQDPPAYTEAEPELTIPVADPYSQLQRMRLSIETVSGQTLTARPDRSGVLLTLDLSRFPVYFPGGCLPGTAIYMYYYGSYNGRDLNGLTIDQVRGVNPASLNTADIRSYVEGTVAGSTADTVTLRCSDGSLFTSRLRTAMGSQVPAPETGSVVRIVLQPGGFQDSSICTALRIERQ